MFELERSRGLTGVLVFPSGHFCSLLAFESTGFGEVGNGGRLSPGLEGTPGLIGLEGLLWSSSFEARIPFMKRSNLSMQASWYS